MDAGQRKYLSHRDLATIGGAVDGLGINGWKKTLRAYMFGTVVLYTVWFPTKGSTGVVVVRDLKRLLSCQVSIVQSS